MLLRQTRSSYSFSNSIKHLECEKRRRQVGKENSTKSLHSSLGTPEPVTLEIVSNRDTPCASSRVTVRTHVHTDSESVRHVASMATKLQIIKELKSRKPTFGCCLFIIIYYFLKIQMPFPSFQILKNIATSSYKPQKHKKTKT